MAQRLICPECRSKLYLRTPAVAATKVKCRDCGHKFYVGHSLEETPAPMPAAMLSAGAAAVLEAEPDAAADLAAHEEELEQQPLVAEKRPSERKRERRRSHDEPDNLPKWLMPVGVIGLLATIILALFFSTKPPPPAERIASSDTDTTTKSSDGKGVGLEGADILDAQKKVFARPAELCGIWRLEGDPTNVIELHEDGLARINAMLLDGPTISFQAKWYLASRQNDAFVLELGLEPGRAGNHRTRLNIEPNGRLRMSFYANGAPGGVSTKIQYFIKSE